MITSDRSTPAVEFQGVTKSFARHSGRILLREKLQHLLAGRQRERFFALKNIAFRLGQGEGLAVVGANGAGKGTLLRLVAGIAPARWWQRPRQRPHRAAAGSWVRVSP